MQRQLKIGIKDKERKDEKIMEMVAGDRGSNNSIFLRLASTAV